MKLSSSTLLIHLKPLLLRVQWLIFLGLFLCSSSVLFAQTPAQAEGKKIEILNANTASFDSKLNPDAQILVGDVRLMHKGVIMQCDSALLFQSANKLEAYGQVVINQGDTLKLFGDSLIYNGNIRQAVVYGAVRLEESSSTLHTNLLRFDVAKSEAYYTTGGEIISKKNNNVLTSTKGTYSSRSKTFFFKEKVHLVNPEYVVLSDTMEYNSLSEQAFFFGPTEIKADSNYLYAENGWYNTKTDLARFQEHAFLISNDQKLAGDSLVYNRNTGIGEAFCNITISDTVNNFLIYGDYGRHNEKNKTSLITIKPRAIKILDTDSLYFKSDTIFIFEDSLSHKTVQAYHKVSFFKNDMQGVADTLIYQESDSSLTLLNAPIIWSDENQITGNTITLYFDGKSPKELYIDKDAFITQLIDSSQNQYNQIKGRELRGYFEEKELRLVHIKGNGQTVYYAQEDKADSTKELIGINVAQCSDITIRLKDSKLEEITFLVQPNAIMYPPEKLGLPEYTLKGFTWFAERRPADLAAIMN